MQGRELIQAMKEKGYAFDGEYLPYDLDVGRYLARHDIVFLTPQAEGYEGLPLGNGDISLMLWTTAEGLRLQVNKNDVWTKPDDEAPMLLRSCARVDIGFAQPCNDWLYLDDFEARLSIGEAKVRYRTVTPFCLVRAEAIVDPESNLVVIDLVYEGGAGCADTAARVSLERYGSRAFAYWYNNITRGARSGLGGARASACGGVVAVSEHFHGDGPQVVTAARLVGQGSSARTVNARRAEIEWSAGGGRAATLLIAVAASAGEDAAGEASRLLDYGEKNLDAIRERHARWWKAFWNRSFVRMDRRDAPTESDYLENLYYLQLYALGSASRGEYPMVFNGGTYTWNRDVRQWVNPHHWNMQQSYWPLEASNHPELAEPYLKAYGRIMPAARRFAREDKGVERGMAISEMHDFSGAMLSYRGALTPASQIAQQFWNHYLYNGDEGFLRESAYPFLRECADFYAEYARMNPGTGKYDIAPAAVCECEFGEDFTNTVVDLATARYILPAAARAAERLGLDADRVHRWKQVLENLADFAFLEGEKGRETLAMGLDREGKKADFGVQNGTFCRNTAPVMPCAIIGLKDKGSRLFNAVYNAAETYPRNHLAITPTSVVWARLGEGERALEMLFHSVAQLQHFPQGFFYNIDHWYQYSRYAKRVDDYLTECQRDYIVDRSLEYAGVSVRNGARGERVDTPMQPFVQCGFETAGILMHAVNEMMLQSHEGVIRVLPSWPASCACAFTLKAAGGFLVSAAAAGGRAAPVAVVKSLLGGSCVLDVPFAPRGVRVCNARGREQHFDVTGRGFVRFMAGAGETYVVYAADIRSDEVPGHGAEYRVNNGHKAYRQATLGRKRMF